MLIRKAYENYVTGLRHIFRVHMGRPEFIKIRPRISRYLAEAERLKAKLRKWNSESPESEINDEGRMHGCENKRRKRIDTRDEEQGRRRNIARRRFYVGSLKPKGSIRKEADEAKREVDWPPLDKGGATSERSARHCVVGAVSVSAVSLERSHVGHARACTVLSHESEKKARAHTQHVHANPLCGISIVSVIDSLGFQNFILLVPSLQAQ